MRGELPERGDCVRVSRERGRKLDLGEAEVGARLRERDEQFEVDQIGLPAASSLEVDGLGANAVEPRAEK